MVSRAARAVGITRKPSASIASSVGVWIASISGTTSVGRSASITPRSAAGSSIGMTWLRWATCIAGAPA
jgi:hypothetical protein